MFILSGSVKIIVVTTLLFILAASSAYAAGTACDAINGRTYFLYMEGQFDGSSTAATYGKATFTSNKSGTVRILYSYALPNASANPGCTFNADGTATCNNAGQQILIVNCSPDSNSMKGVFTFTSTGGDAGGETFTVYDKGSKLWVENHFPGRVMSGWWYLQQPAPIR